MSKADESKAIEITEVSESEMKDALIQAMSEASQASKPPQSPRKKASKAKTGSTKGKQASKAKKQPSKAESSQDDSQGISKTEARKISQAQKTTNSKTHEVNQAMSQGQGILDYAVSKAVKLTPDQQAKTGMNDLNGLLATIQTAQKTAQTAQKQASQAEAYSQAAEARESAKKARSEAYQALKKARQIARAIDRAIARADKQAKKQAEKARKQQEKINQALSKASKAKQAIEEYESMLQSQAETSQGNKVIDVDMNQALADMLNMVADSLWAEFDSQGNVHIIPADITLTTARQQALMSQVIDMGYIVQTESGYTFTESGLALFKTDWQEVKANFAQMLGQPASQAS